MYDCRIEKGAFLFQADYFISELQILNKIDVRIIVVIVGVT